MCGCAIVPARLALAALAMSATVATAQPVTVTHPAGSAFEKGTDLLRLDFETRDGALVMRMTVASDPVVAEIDDRADPPQTQYKVATGGVAIVFVDADGDPGTGERPYGWSEGGGFEYTLAIDFCMELPDQAGCPTGYDYRATGGKVLLTLAPMGGGEPWTGASVLDEATVDLSVPYQAFGGTPGAEIRVHVLETTEAYGQPADDSGAATIALR